MTDLEVRPYRYFHPLAPGFIPRAKHAEAMAFMLRDGWFGRAEGRYSWSLFDPDGLVAFGGITPVGRAWAFPSATMRSRHVRPALSFVQRVLRQHLDERGPVKADIDPMDPVAVRFAKMLGFRKTPQPGPFPHLEVWCFDGTDRSS